jgi:hypothetical protein
MAISKNNLCYLEQLDTYKIWHIGCTGSKEIDHIPNLCIDDPVKQ